MNERLIEVAEEIAKRTEDHMLHKGAEIGGLAFLSSFHAALTILSQIKEFTPEIKVKDDPDFDEVGEALMGGMMPIYAASDAIKEKAAKADAGNPAEWREWCLGELPVPGMNIYRVDKKHHNFSYGVSYTVCTISSDGGVTVCDDYGDQRFIVSRQLLEFFRPAV